LTGQALNKPLYLFYLAGALMVGGGFVLYTSGANLSMAQDPASGSIISQVILAAFYTIAALLLASSRDFLKIMRVVWPLLLLPALAMLSMLWSPEPTLTLRRAVAFAGTVLFGISLGAAYQYRDAALLLCRMLVLALLLSIAVAIFDPFYGMHQAWEANQAEHAGAWRGIFGHRNTLGLWSGATLATLVVAGREALWNRPLWLAGMAVAAACLVFSGSSAGIAIAVLMLVFHAGLVMTLRQPPRLRPLAGLLMSAVIVLLLLSYQPIVEISLELLGRESDLSGRTMIWYYIVQFVQGMDRPLGLGYFVGAVSLQDHLSALTRTRVVNAHNGYLEAFVYFGYPGLALCAGMLGWLFYRTLGFVFAHDSSVTGPVTLPAVFVFMAGVHNMVESTIVLPNNLNTLLLAYAGGVVARSIHSQSEDRIVAAGHVLSEGRGGQAR
jgi:exopolysaccharide production protein ExoQ